VDLERQQAEQRIEEARRSIEHRLEALGELVDRTRRRLDVADKIRGHLGLSLGAGALVGFLVGRRRRVVRGLLAGEIAAAPVRRPGLVATIVADLVRTAATTLLASATASLVRPPEPHAEDERSRPWER
jgi:hypothetical protein